MILRKSATWLVALVVGIGLGAAAITWSQAVDSSLSVPAARSPDDLSVAFRDVARRVLPAVVWIETHSGSHGTTEETQRRAPNPGEDLFRRFFGDDPRFKDFQFPELPQIPQFPSEGHGSGFIIDPSGIILTNAHVVQGAEKVIVHLYDGSEQRAESWVADRRSDVAVIRIKAEKPLPVIPLGNSDLMQVGDWVLAAGNPFDVGVTVTAGIISATGRGPGINDREGYLQTDAAINPGNSGGPLINLNGEVIGINTAISTSSGGYDGVGFAIPINMARWVADQLIKDGEVRRAFLGVALSELTNDLRQAFHVALGEGALVLKVFDNTPASRAGLQAGDIILEIGGQKVLDRGHLQGIVEALESGKSYPLVVLRNGERLTIDVTLEAMPKDYTAATQRGRSTTPDKPSREQAKEFDKLGLQVQEITDELRSQLDLADGTQGVVITSVKSGSLAGLAGLQAGDVIERVGSTTVKTPEEFRAAVDALSLEKGVALLVTRGQASQFVVLKSE